MFGTWCPRRRKVDATREGAGGHDSGLAVSQSQRRHQTDCEVVLSQDISSTVRTRGHLSPLIISRALTVTSRAGCALTPSSEHPRLLPEAGLLSSRTLFHPGDPLGVHLTLDFWLVIRAQPPIHPQFGRTALTPLLDDAVSAPALSVLRCSHPPSWSSCLPPPIAPSPAHRAFPHPHTNPRYRARPRPPRPSMSTAAATPNSSSNALNQASNSGRQLKMSTAGKGIDPQRKPGSPIDGGQR